MKELLEMIIINAKNAFQTMQKLIIHYVLQPQVAEQVIMVILIINAQSVIQAGLT